MVNYMVRLWKFEQHRYGEREAWLRFNPEFAPSHEKQSWWKLIRDIYRAWKGGTNV